MGIAERRKREKAARRREIISCARDIILRQGVERVTMEEIAQKAELSKATLYLYFSNKESIFNEICEESAQRFLEYMGQLSQTGIEAIRYLWQGYIKLFGDGDKMLVVFQIRNFLSNWLPTEPRQKGKAKSPYIGAILETIHAIIEQCKIDGLFDPNLNSTKAVHLILLLFSSIVKNTAKLPPEARNSPAMIHEMTSVFQIMIRGFAREGIEHSRLNITWDATNANAHYSS